MRVFKVKDGTSWTARVAHGTPAAEGERRVGWEAVMFESTPAGAAARLVYRPAGWLGAASVQELAEALEEGAAVRSRWQPER